MASTINASTASTTGLVQTADASGVLQLQSDGVTGLTVNANANVTVNTNLFVSGSSMQPMVLSTSQSTTSGTSVDFTNIPSWVKRITVMLNDVSSTTLSGYFYVRLGAGSIVSTGYTAMNATITTTNNTTTGTTHTTGFFAGFTGGTSTASTASSIMIINKFSDTSTIWTSQTIGLRNNDSGTYFTTAFGKVDISGTLDRLSLVTTVGTFDAGSVNIMYE